jgi:RPA family protein
MATYDKGDLVRVTGTFTNAAGTAIDPTMVKFQVLNPAGTTTTYTYGVDAALVKSAVGVYYVDISADVTGIYYYRFYSTGTGQAADEGQFTSDESRF